MRAIRTFGAVLFAVLAHTALAVEELDVAYDGEAIRLAAALLRPASAGQTPAVVVAQGSGDSDRTNVWSQRIAGIFVDNGYSVLLTDKRGSGKSGGDWRNASFQDLADDVIVGVKYLQSRDDVIAERVGAVGLSQGGRVVPIAAARCECVAFVVNVSGDAVGAIEQSFHEMRNTARQAGLNEDGIAEILELNAAAGRFVLEDEWEAYERRRARAMKGPAAPVARGFPATADDPRWTFIEKTAFFTPLPYWMFVEQPALILYGAEDESDNVAVAESSRRLEFAFRQVGKDNYRIAIIEDVGHGLRRMHDPEIAPDVQALIGEWLGEIAARPRP